MPTVKILNLGDIVTQDQMKSLSAFSKLVNPSDPTAAMKILGPLLQSKETKELLDQFKQGLKTQKEFIDKMIQSIHEKTGKTIQPAQFITAWNAMNPSFKEFSQALLEVSDEDTPHQKIILVSYTNPIDMAHLLAELMEHNIANKCSHEGELESIAGMPLFTTYTAKKTKAELIQSVVWKASYDPTFFTTHAVAPSRNRDVKYIRGIQDDLDPILKALSEKSHAEVTQTTAALGINTLLWYKNKGQPFKEAICSNDVFEIPAAKL
jgi:hypothetical protein